MSLITKNQPHDDNKLNLKKPTVADSCDKCCNRLYFVIGGLETALGFRTHAHSGYKRQLRERPLFTLE